MNDPAIALPLLRGLSRATGPSGRVGWGNALLSGGGLRSEESNDEGTAVSGAVTPAARVLLAALRRYWAHRLLRRALRRWVARRRRDGDAGRGDGDDGDSSDDWHRDDGGTHHFLFQSLLHPSIQVRRTGARMIVDSIHSLGEEAFFRGGDSDGNDDNDNNGDDDNKNDDDDNKNDDGDKKNDDNDKNNNKNNNSNKNNINTIGNPRYCLREVLLSLFHELLFDCRQSSFHRHRHLQHKSVFHQMQGGDPAIQLGGMLTSLICHGGFPDVVVEKELRKRMLPRAQAGGGDLLGGGNDRGDGERGGTTEKKGDDDASGVAKEVGPSGGSAGDSAGDGAENDKTHGEGRGNAGDHDNDDDGADTAILCKDLLEQLSSHSIESFVAAGGLRWACGSIVRLVHMLVHGPNDPARSASWIHGVHHSHSHSHNHHHQDGMDAGAQPHGHSSISSGEWHRLDDISAEMIQTRLLLLIDLVYRLVLYGSVPAAVNPKLASLSESATVGGGGGGGSGGSGGDDDNTRPNKGNGNDGNAHAGSSSSSSNTSKKRKHSILHDLDGSGGNVPESRSRLSTLRQSIRSSLARSSSPSTHIAGKRHSNDLGGSTGQGNRTGSARSAGAGGEHRPSSTSSPNRALSDENKSRKERRKAALERVHRLLWSSNLPAAICHPSIQELMTSGGGEVNGVLPTLGSEPAVIGGNGESSSDAVLFHGTFSPLACLIAAYEILRAPPTAVPTLATNTQLIGMEQGISILGRMVDPAAGAAVVVIDPDIPREKNGSTGVLPRAVASPVKGTTPRLSGKKRRDRSASQESHRSRSPNNSSRRSRLRGPGPAAGTAAAARSGNAGGASNDTTSANTIKRARASAVASLLERLNHGDQSLVELRGAFSGFGAFSEGGLGTSSSSSAPLGGLTAGSLLGTRYRASALESMLGIGFARDQGVSSMLSEVTRNQSARGSALSAVPSSASALAASPSRPLAEGSARQSLRDEEGWNILGDENDQDEDMETVEHDDALVDEEDGEVCDDDDESDYDDHDKEGGEARDAGGDDDDDDGSCDDDDDDDDHHDDEKSDSEPEDNGQFDDAIIVLDEVANVAAANSTAPTSANNPHRQSSASTSRNAGGRSGSASRVYGSGPSNQFDKKEREQAYIFAAMQILGAQYPDTTVARYVKENTRQNESSFSIFARQPALLPPPLLTSRAEQSLLISMCDIVKPPRKPLNLKIFLRRAPTQEEFFRGSLSRNPITLSSLSAGTQSSQGGGGEDRRTSTEGGGNDSSSHGNNEPRVRDLRQHIADDLQMSDSAELLELIVANKILDMNLKLRVVQQVLWKKYVMENSTSASSLISGAGPGHQMINTGSGLSMIFSSSSLTARSRGSGGNDDNLLSSFPPMVVTYRLAGVDGEATEDTVEVEDLVDPEAPGSVSPSAKEKQMEKEFGVTRVITQGRGVSIILSSIESTISGLLRRIRRDEVVRRRRLLNGSQEDNPNTDGNITREKFAKSRPCPGLVLLRHCANLSENRKKLLAARAPTVLLRMLLDILNAMNKSLKLSRSSASAVTPSESMDVDEAENASNENTASDVASSSNVTSRHRGSHMECNPTTDMLQEIIEMLASDISAEVSQTSKDLSRPTSFVNINQRENEQSPTSEDDDGTLSLVLKSLHSTQLSAPLRKVIAKLLPFLTYGQVSQSKELASYFDKYVNVESLGMMETYQKENKSILMTTFVETAISLPPVSVCDNLRKELIQNGFVNKVRMFVVKDAPTKPAPWSPALYSKLEQLSDEKAKSDLKEKWRRYFNRRGLAYAIKVLTGLCSKHSQMQLLLADNGTGSAEESSDLLTLCHWIESTSDNTSSGITTNDIGILAETLLDELKQDNQVTSDKIDLIRKKTRERKREIAEERRNKALVGMSAFGPLVGSAASEKSALATRTNHRSAAAPAPSDARSGSMLASMFGLSSFLSPSSETRASSSAKGSCAETKMKPAWMTEMEAMDDEAFACAVCQEGRTLQPSELLGLYAFTKKVTISSAQGGAKSDIDGTNMLLALPKSLPLSSVTVEMTNLFRKGKTSADALQGSHALSAMNLSSVGSSKNNYYITTVSAGNAIHCSCHTKAKAADRSNPKAPKSEWEGATLRNSRVTCNVILPLVSSKVSEVPLMAVEAALADVHTVVTNTLGTRPKSMLWIVLHDIRFLLLRMAHGESLNSDCGGGSLSSNFLLLLYQMYSADMYAINAEHDESPEVAKHAHGLSSGFLAAVEIVQAPGFDRHDPRLKRLERGIADTAPMASLCSILFFNSGEESLGSSAEGKTPSPKRQWELYKEKFLLGLIKCAGRRHSLGVTDSGCVTSRGISTGRKNIERARSYADWGDGGDFSKFSSSSGTRMKKGGNMINEYSVALRPMITLYATFDQLSKEFVLNNDDESTDLSSGRLASKLEECYKASSIHDLLHVADIAMDQNEICKIFERGALS
ncbi:hypothetical protein ACHAXS_007506 [Conticribra weissflogii]